MQVKKSVPLLSLFVAAVLSAGIARAATDNDVVATINGKTITKEDFDRRYKDSLQIFKFTPPTKANTLNDIINFELAVQEAKKEGIDKDPEVQERINNVIYQSLVEKKLQNQFAKAVNITDQEAKDYCRRNPEIRTSHIYVLLKPTHLVAEEKAANERINNAMAALKRGEKFETVVSKFSEGYAKDLGGDIGYQTKDKLDPSYYEDAKKLKVGEYTDHVVKSQFGLHIIKLTGVKDCNKINIPEYQRMVYDEKRMKIFDDYLNKLRSSADISINQDLIKE